MSQPPQPRPQLERIPVEGEYALLLIKGWDAKHLPFSAYLMLNKTDADVVQQCMADGKPLNLNGYRDNIIYHKRGHDVSESEHADAMNYVGKHYTGRRYPQ